eukprot:760327-Hanusia_phi.AAC.5
MQENCDKKIVLASNGTRGKEQQTESSCQASFQWRDSKDVRLLKEYKLKRSDLSSRLVSFLPSSSLSLPQNLSPPFSRPDAAHVLTARNNKLRGDVLRRWWAAARGRRRDLSLAFVPARLSRSRGAKERALRIIECKRTARIYRTKQEMCVEDPPQHERERPGEPDSEGARQGCGRDQTGGGGSSEAAGRQHRGSGAGGGERCRDTRRQENRMLRQGMDNLHHFHLKHSCSVKAPPHFPLAHELLSFTHSCEAASHSVPCSTLGLFSAPRR